MSRNGLKRERERVMCGVAAKICDLFTNHLESGLTVLVLMCNIKVLMSIYERLLSFA